MLRSTILVVSSGMLLACSTFSVADDAIEDAVRGYLAVKYDEYVQSDDERIVYGLAYNSTHAIEPVAIVALAQFKPKTLYFRTVLDTPYVEYPRLNVIISVSPAERRWDIRSCVSTTFTKPSPKFLAQFQQPEVVSKQDALKYVRGVAELFASITVKGEVANSRYNGGIAIAELWHQERPWREIQFVQAKPDGSAGQTLKVAHPTKKPIPSRRAKLTPGGT